MRPPPPTPTPAFTLAMRRSTSVSGMTLRARAAGFRSAWQYFARSSADRAPAFGDSAFRLMNLGGRGGHPARPMSRLQGGPGGVKTMGYTTMGYRSHRRNISLRRAKKKVVAEAYSPTPKFGHNSTPRRARPGTTRLQKPMAAHTHTYTHTCTHARRHAHRRTKHTHRHIHTHARPA